MRFQVSVSRRCRPKNQAIFGHLRFFGRPNRRLTSPTRSDSENTSPAGRGRRALARRVRVTRPDVSRSRSLTLRTSRSCEAKLAEGDRLNTENVRQHSRPRVPPRTPPEPSVRLPDFRGRQTARRRDHLFPCSAVSCMCAIARRSGHPPRQRTRG